MKNARDFARSAVNTILYQPIFFSDWLRIRGHVFLMPTGDGVTSFASPFATAKRRDGFMGTVQIPGKDLLVLYSVLYQKLASCFKRR